MVLFLFQYCTFKSNLAWILDELSGHVWTGYVADGARQHLFMIAPTECRKVEGHQSKGMAFLELSPRPPPHYSTGNTMSAYEVLFVNGVASFFTCVAVVSGTAAWLLFGLPPAAVLLVVVASIVWTAQLWVVFASYARDIWQMPHVLFNLVVALVRATFAYALRGWKPLFPQWTFKFELLRVAMRALRGGIFAQNVVQSRNARYFCKQFELLGKRSGPASCKSHDTKMQIVTHHGMEHVWIRDRHDHHSVTDKVERFVVIYYHGGGFVLFAPHYFVDLMNRLRASMMKQIRIRHPEMSTANISIECFLANYRKSPDHKYPIPQEDALLMYEYVLQSEQLDGNRIVITGDSAGGGLCMSTLLRLKQKRGPMPAAAMLSCPFVDFAVDEHTVDDSNCMFAMELGRAMMVAFHPSPHDKDTWKDAAPVYYDLSGLPPALIQVGSVDTIYQSAIKLYEKAQADGLGAQWELDVFPNMPHAFTCLPETALPDVKKAIDHIAEFAVRHLLRRTLSS